MTEQELKSYRKLCREADDLRKRIEKEKKQEIPIISGKVRGSMREFPYIETHVGVEMYEPEVMEASMERIRRYKAKLLEAEQKKLEIEQFVEQISEPELRLIFRYRFLDGMKQEVIARKLNMTQSNVSKLISKKMKLE
ncbi:MAG: sigma-70 family RNA polymerase sigma factor [Lachnospiraceae bacterium]|jgi:RNA polymerase sigma factor (sigma-70 family)|nr:sigma-70 family RNA polymerase sigma factor [Lachnospiraceae bacterium]